MKHRTCNNVKACIQEKWNVSLKEVKQGAQDKDIFNKTIKAYTIL